jgi:dCMP deaminase
MSSKWTIKNDFLDNLKHTKEKNEKLQRELHKIGVFKDICLNVSALSYDDKFKVGTIIITDDFRDICAIGYNGNYKGGPNCRDSMETGGSGFLHSEENALFHLSKPYELRDRLIMICTHKPCPMCAKRIVNAGIKRVFFIKDYSDAGAGTDEIFVTSKVLCKKI